MDSENHKHLDSIFAVDLRSLAILRIAYGFIAFGFLKRSGLLFSTEPISLLISVLALALIIGYRSQWAAAGMWVAIGYVLWPQRGNTDYGYLMYRLLLFWSIFQPLDAKWAFSKFDSKGRTRVLSAASAALLIQIGIIYFVGGVTKSAESWFIKANALERIMHWNQHKDTFAAALLNYPNFLRFGSRFTYVLEVLGPLLLFFPFVTRQLRYVLVPLFVSLHVAMLFTIPLGHFPYICIISWISFCPSEIWDRILQVPKSYTPKPQTLLETSKIKNCIVALFLSLSIFSAYLVLTPEFYKTQQYREIQRWFWKIGFKQQWIMYNMPSR